MSLAKDSYSLCVFLFYFTLYVCYFNMSCRNGVALIEGMRRIYEKQHLSLFETLYPFFLTIVRKERNVC